MTAAYGAHGLEKRVNNDAAKLKVKLSSSFPSTQPKTTPPHPTPQTASALFTQLVFSAATIKMAKSRNKMTVAWVAWLPSTNYLRSSLTRSHTSSFSPSQKAWNSAANIQLIHSVALLAISQSPALLARSSRYAAPLMLLGTTLFSGSIYTLILDTDKTISRTFRLGLATPLGGVVLIAGWFALAL